MQYIIVNPDFIDNAYFMHIKSKLSELSNSADSRRRHTQISEEKPGIYIALIYLTMMNKKLKRKFSRHSQTWEEKSSLKELVKFMGSHLL